MKTVTITAAIVGTSALVADLIFSVNTFFRHKKMLVKLCDENAELLSHNTHLQAVNAGLHRKKADLERQIDTCLNRGIEQNDVIIKREHELETVRAANLIVSRDLDAAREEIKQLKLKLAASENKFKQAAEHINVLRIEINRKNNRRKK